MRLKCFLGCPLVWSISSAKYLNKVENLQKRGLRFLHNDYSSSYEELFKKAGKITLNVFNYRSLCIEIFKIGPHACVSVIMRRSLLGTIMIFI